MEEVVRKGEEGMEELRNWDEETSHLFVNAVEDNDRGGSFERGLSEFT